MSSVGTDPRLLVGRGVERSLLLDSLERARHGTGEAVALLGAAGVGKSRLSRELWSAGGEAGVPVLVGRAVPTASAVPYRAVRESLLSWSRTHPLPAADALGDYARAVDHLTGDGAPGGQPMAPVFIAEAFLRVLAVISENGGRGPSGGGCVVLLEDLHWADDETLAVVEYVADHAAATGVLVTLTSRYDEPGAARPLLDALGARGSLRAIRLAPLNRDEVGTMAADLLGEPVAPALVDLLHERSEGVPLLVEELLAALQGSHGLTHGSGGVEAADASARVLPSSVADTVRARLTSLPADHRTVLETAAVFGRSFDWRVLAPVAQVDEAVVLEALRTGTEVTLLEPDPARAGELRFRHALIRDAVTAATFPPQRGLLARRALDVLLETVQQHDHDEDLSLAVELADLCDDHALAARLALRVAWRAFDGWSLGTAARWLARARRFAGTDTELLVEIDQLQIRVGGMVGRVDVVRTVGGALLARVPEDDHEVRLDVHLRLAQVEAEDGNLDQSRQHLAVAEPLLADSTDACALTRHALWSTVTSIAAGDLVRGRRHALRTIELAQPYDDQVDLHCAALMHLGRAALPNVTKARGLWQEALDLATDNGLRLWRGRLLAELGGQAVMDVEGDEQLAEALALAHEAGAVELAQRVELLRAELALLRGRPDDTRSHLEAAERIAARGEVASPTQDRATALRALLDTLGGAPVSAASPRYLRGLAALAADDLDAARARALSAVGNVAPRPGTPYDHLLGLLDATSAAPRADLGRVGAGLTAARTAIAATGSGARERAVTALVESARLLEPAPWLRAFTVRLTGQAVVHAAAERTTQGTGTELRDLLRDAAVTFDRMGLARPADACRALLRDLGVAVPRRQSAQVGVPEELRALGVTARELDVLRLVAEGLSSRDIAERLFLSPRTVEKHVERLLAKTGAPNRTALVAHAALAPRGGHPAT